MRERVVEKFVLLGDRALVRDRVVRRLFCWVGEHVCDIW